MSRWRIEVAQRHHDRNQRVAGRAPGPGLAPHQGIEQRLPLAISHLLAMAAKQFTGNANFTDPTADVQAFVYDRLRGLLRERGHAQDAVEAVVAQSPDRLDDIAERLDAVKAFAAMPQAESLAAANKRITNILKKAGEVDAHVNTALLQEDAEKNLHAVMQKLLPESEAQFKAGDYTASLQTLAALRSPVDAFFDDVMVNAEEMDLRLNRQGLLKSLHLAMNRVADLSCLAA